MSERRWLRYPRHIAGQIALVVFTSIGLALALVIAIIIMTRPEADRQNSSHAVDAFLGVAWLLDATADANSRSNILEAAVGAFPDLQIKITSAHDELNGYVPAGLSYRSVWKSAIGVPTGIEGSDMSIVAVVEKIAELPVVEALLRLDGAAAVSADQTGVPANCGPPALMR